MKRFLLILPILLFFTYSQAQEEVACIPDTTLQDSFSVVFPLPLNEGVGGLAEFPACVNEPYELVFTLMVPDSINNNGLLIDVASASIETTGAIVGLPEGVDYFCNPPDCVFSDTLAGCIVLRGTPTSNNAPGNYELVISGVAQLGPLPFPVTFPGLLAPGSYALTLQEEGSCEETTTSVNYLAEQISLSNSPNPVQYQTKIEMTSLTEGDFQFRVFDNAGKEVHTRNIQLRLGYNAFQFDASALNNGLYFYTISDGKAMIYEKMVVENN